jgi:DNA-binding transcriptional LysR family regulator
MVDPEDLRVFVEAATRGTFTAAARSLHTTQASISRHIDRLEQALGGQLFDRSNRRTPHLTPLGEAALPFAEQLIADLARFEEYLRLHSQGKRGVLSIALSEVVAPAAVPAIARRVRARLPGIGLQFRQCAAAEGTINAVRGREAELGVLSSDHMTDEFEGVTFAVVQHLAIGVPQLLGASASPIEWDTLSQLPLLLTLPRRLVTYRLENRPTNVVHENGGPELLIAMAEAGLGVALLTSANKSEGLVRRPIEIFGVPQRTSLLMVWLKGRVLTTPARRLTDDLRHQLAHSGPPMIDNDSSGSPAS